MENEIKLNGTILAENNAAGTEEDPILSLIRAKYMDSEGKVHLAFLQTLLSSVVDKDGKRLDRTIEELQDAVGIGGGTVTELINTEIDKKVGDLADLETDAKDLIVNAINEINQGLDKKLQYVPVPVEITQNPETYKTGYIYAIEGEVSEENGHPYTASWTHITYLVFGDDNEENSYKNIIGIDYRGKIYNKSQGLDAWSNWTTLATLADLSSKPDKMYTIFNKGRITNDVLTESAFHNDSWIGVGYNLENAPSSNWFNFLYLGAGATGSDYSEILAIEINGNNQHLYFTANVKAKKWFRILDTRDFLENISNENILINSDFRNPINQRGSNKYEHGNEEGYSIDRWLCSYSTCEIKNGYIRVEFTSAWNMFQQRIEDLKKYMGQIVTLSVKYRDAENVRLNIRSVSSAITNSTEFVGESFSGSGIISLTGVVPTVESPAELMVSLQATAVGAYADVEWMKLEIGREATVFVPQNRKIELSKCKRYFQKLGGWWKYMAVGFVSKTDKVAKFPLILESVMRVVPTLTIQNKERIKVIGSNINVDIMDLEGFQNASENYYNISFSLPEGTVVETLRDFVALYFGENVELQFDAEIY